MNRIIGSTVGALVLIALAGCDPVGKAWQQAEEANTIESYRAFREANPGTDYDSLASQRIDDLAWDAVVAEDSESAYLSYLEEHVDGANAALAAERVGVMRLARFTSGLDSHLLAFVRGEKSDIATLQGKSWSDLNLNIGLKSGGFDLINGRTVIREGSEVVFEDKDKLFQIVGVVSEAQYASSVKPASLVSTEFVDGVTLGLTSGEVLDFADQRWTYANAKEKSE